MITRETFEEIRAKILEIQADIKERCIRNDLAQDIEWYRGGFAALQSIVDTIERDFKIKESEEKRDKERERALDSVDKIRASWMPGMPLIPDDAE